MTEPMTQQEIEEIRALHEQALSNPDCEYPHYAVPLLCDEVARLQSALDAAEKRADKWKQAADDAGANTMFDPE
jgi:hypothetical protein